MTSNQLNHPLHQHNQRGAPESPGRKDCGWAQTHWASQPDQDKRNGGAQCEQPGISNPDGFCHKPKSCRCWWLIEICRWQICQANDIRKNKNAISLGSCQSGLASSGLDSPGFVSSWSGKAWNTRIHLDNVVFTSSKHWVSCSTPCPLQNNLYG